MDCAARSHGSSCKPLEHTVYVENAAMLFLQFQIGDDRYVIDTARVGGVLPLVSLTRIPQSTPGIAGVFNYRRRPVPLIDLTELAIERPADKRLSTRVI